MQSGEWSKYQAEDGAEIIAVKLSDHCGCDAERLARSTCGHHWCERCGGYVDAISRVCQKNPGPVIHCNRGPKWREGYDAYFREIGGADDQMTKAMRMHLGNSRVMRRSTTDLAIKLLYEIHKREASKGSLSCRSTGPRR